MHIVIYLIFLNVIEEGKMKCWTIKIFDEYNKQIPFENEGSVVMETVMKSNSKFSIKKLAKIIVNNTPSAASCSIKYDGEN